MAFFGAFFYGFGRADRPDDGPDGSLKILARPSLPTFSPRAAAVGAVARRREGTEVAMPAAGRAARIRACRHKVSAGQAESALGEPATFPRPRLAATGLLFLRPTPRGYALLFMLPG